MLFLNPRLLRLFVAVVRCLFQARVLPLVLLSRFAFSLRP